MKKNTVYAIFTMAAVLSAGFAIPAAASEWSIEDGEWAYIDNAGQKVTEAWKDDGAHTYYLGSDGYIVRSSLIEVNGNYYYLNSSGAMVTNEWRQLENQKWQDESPEEEHWYYFQANGRAFRSSNGAAAILTLNNKRYAFDSYGRMVTGWIGEAGEMLDDTDGWTSALYYADAEEDGSLLVNAWLQADVNDEEGENSGSESWFYFTSNGKKASDGKRTINGKEYYFDGRGKALSGWQTIDGAERPRYYGTSDQCYLQKGWFMAVPSEELDAQSYYDDASCWFYSSGSGDIAVMQMKTINDKRYAFNEFGGLLTGLYKIKMGEDKVITEYAKVGSGEDLPGESSEWGVYYLGEEDGDGAARTGSQTIDLDGENAAFSFASSGTYMGRGLDGFSGNYLYINGRRQKAEAGSKCQAVSYGDLEYLVNTSGTVMKSKTNTTDSDGIYFCTDKNGVITYRGSEKYTA